MFFFLPSIPRLFCCPPCILESICHCLFGVCVLIAMSLFMVFLVYFWKSVWQLQLLWIYTSISPWFKKLFNVVSQIFKQLYSSSSDHVFFSNVIMAVWKFVEFQLPAHFTCKMKCIIILNKAYYNYFAMQQFSFSISWLLITLQLTLTIENYSLTTAKNCYPVLVSTQIRTRHFGILTFVFFFGIDYEGTGSVPISRSLL